MTLYLTYLDHSGATHPTHTKLVLDLMRQRIYPEWRTQDIAAALELHPARVSRILTDLKEHGCVERVKVGWWKAV